MLAKELALATADFHCHRWKRARPGLSLHPRFHRHLSLFAVGPFERSGLLVDHLLLPCPFPPSEIFHPLNLKLLRDGF